MRRAFGVSPMQTSEDDSGCEWRIGMYGRHVSKVSETFLATIFKDDTDVPDSS